MSKRDAKLPRVAAPFFSKFPRSRTPMEVDFPTGCAVARRKVEISKLSHQSYLYETRGHMANKIDLGCTSHGIGGKEKEGLRAKERSGEQIR